MTATRDDRSFAPPHELVGPLGQVIDLGGGLVPGLQPAPVPGALGTTSPGLAATAVAPDAPVSGPDDPRVLALAIERIASELVNGPFGGAVAPVPVAPASTLTASNVQLPGSPGADDPSALAIAIDRLARELLGGPSRGSALPAVPAPVAPSTTGSASSLDRQKAQGVAPELVPSASVPSESAASASVAPVGAIPDNRATSIDAHRPGMAGPSFDSSPFVDAPAFGGPAFGSPLLDSPAFGAPAFGAPAFGAPAFSAPASGAPAFGAPAFGAPVSGAPDFSALAFGAPAFGAPASGAPAFGAPAFGVPAPATPSFAQPAAPTAAQGASALGAGVPGSSFGSLPTLDVVWLPILDGAPRVDAAPYFLPATDAVGIETDRGGPRVVAYEVDAQPAVIRNLGRDLGGSGFDPYAIRRDFPILEERVHGGKRLVWLDNAATTQKPRAVIDRLSYFYEHENSNIHRAAHALAARATDAYEAGRESVRRFLGAGSTSEIIFVRGATEGINLVAQSWGRRNVAAGDEIVITHLEHHANIVPWQQLCAATGARLRIAPVDDRGDVILDAYERLLGPRTRLVAFPQVSNAIGTVTPAREMIEIAHRHGAVVLLDGAQAVSHMRVDVQLLDCDFYTFSGHKVFAPTGIGVVFGKRAILDAMPPWQGGGNMIQDVTFERTTYQEPPWRFEAGTGNIADAVGLGAALDYVTRIGIDTIDRYEHELLGYAERRLATVPGLTMIGAPREKAGVLSFVLDGQRTEDVGSALDQEGIAVRSGHHCAQPILRRFGVEATVRASLAFYNVCEDIDALTDALCRLQAGRG